MSTPFFATVAAAADHLTIAAFDAFCDAAVAAGLALPVINAFAAYKCAVDFTLGAAEASAKGDLEEADKLLGWSGAKLGDMQVAVSALSTGADQ